MTFAYLIIDMQIVEKEKFAFARQWTSLCRIVCGIRDKLTPYGVLVVYVVSIDKKTIEPCVGPRASIDAALVARKAFYLCGGNERSFAIPVGQTALVSVKNTDSTCTPPLEEALRKRGVSAVLLAGLREGSPGGNYVARCVTASAVAFAKAGFCSIIIAEGTNVHATGKRVRDKEDVMAYLKEGVHILPFREVRRLVRGERPLPQKLVFDRRPVPYTGKLLDYYNA